MELWNWEANMLEDARRPPHGLVRWLRDQGRLQVNVLSCKVISREEADSGWSEDAVDLRDSPCGGDQKKGRAAAVWCSCCEGTALVRYHTKTTEAVPWIEWYSWADDAVAQCDIGKKTTCPLCGEKASLQGQERMRYGYSDQTEVLVPQIACGGLLVTRYQVAAVVFGQRKSVSAAAWDAAWCDGSELRAYSNYVRYFNKMVCRGWKRLERIVDKWGDDVLLYTGELPAMDGSGVENCRLWELAKQCGGAPPVIAWLRLWMQHRNAEVLVDAGLGAMLVEAARQEMRGSYYGTKWKRPKLQWIRWKERKAEKMLGLTKEQLQRAKAASAGARVYQRMAPGNAEELLEAFEAVGRDESELERVCALGTPVRKTARYLAKQGARALTLRDYWRMANAAGWDMTQEQLIWPKDLRAAHDRALAQAKAARDEMKAKDWAEMTEKLRGLAWERNGICIRAAESQAELTAEGNTLHHCVGRYGQQHLNGEIILFVRHTRRPERSWFTLNVDLETRKRIQLHGYGNEYAHGKPLTIPREVLEFVDAWEKEILAGWKPPKKKQEAKNGKRTKAA